MQPCREVGSPITIPDTPHSCIKRSPEVDKIVPETPDEDLPTTARQSRGKQLEKSVKTGTHDRFCVLSYSIPSLW